MTLNKNQKFLVAGIIVVLIIFIATSKTEVKTDMSNTQNAQDWQTSYAASATMQLQDYGKNTENTNYYDYDDPAITNAANKISSESSTPKEAITKTLDYVYKNIQYTWSEADSACIAGTAPKILESGIGQCDTQSMVVIAILRKMGIAAKPVGGCIYQTSSCGLQAVFPFNQPKFTEIELADDQTEFSRKGGLHAWVTAWTPEDGWLTLEATTGKIANTDCWNYHVELFVQDSNKLDMCITTNYDYAKACQINDLNQLNANGLGLTNEVSP